MAKQNKLYFGYDPGGKDAAGVATIEVGSERLTYKLGTVSSVDEALDWFVSESECSPHAMGIDTYLYWETGISGWRGADRWLRKTYPDVKRSVFASNSAFGSMAVQGMATAIRTREMWPEIALNETHPKVLYKALSGQKYKWGKDMNDWLLEKIGEANGPMISNDHEFDAPISAWAAMQVDTQQWTNNLLHLSENTVQPAGPVSYYWPDCL